MNPSRLATPSADNVLDEVAIWIERRDREGWSADDQAAFDSWIAQSPAHLVAFLRADNAWTRANRLSALRTPLNSPERGIKRYTWTRNLRIAVFLAIIGVVGAAALTYTMRPSEETYSTPVGGHKVLSFADGSRVELNTDTVLQIGKRGAQRWVKLYKGEVFFEIKHNAAYPFIVTAANHRITDLGTKFVIRDSENHLHVALIEGRVQIESTVAGSHSGIAILAKGDTAVATANSISVQRLSADGMAQALAWRHSVLVLDNTTLADAAADFNRYNIHKLVVTDPVVAKLTVVGKFHTNDVEAFAEVAQDILHLHVTKYGDQTVISR